MSLILSQGLYLIISGSKELIISVLTKLGYYYQKALKLVRKEKKELDETSELDKSTETA